MLDLFSRLDELSTRLNEASDTLSQTITQVETKLRELRLGLSAWVVLENDPLCDGNGQEHENAASHLGYAKLNGTWQLVISEGFDDLKYFPLKQAPRETRLKAITLFPVLLEEIAKQAEAALREVGKAKQVADSLIEHISEKQK